MDRAVRHRLAQASPDADERERLDVAAVPGENERLGRLEMQDADGDAIGQWSKWNCSS